MLKEILEFANRQHSANERLFDAIIAGNFKAFQKALAEGASVNARTPDDDIQTGNSRSTPLIEASWRTNDESDAIFNHLVSNPTTNINAVDGQKISAVMKATLSGNLDRVEKLVDAGASLLHKDNEGLTAVDYAKNWAPELAEYLSRKQREQLRDKKPGMNP